MTTDGEGMDEPPRSSSGEHVADANSLAMTRTVLAAERTLMAWIRTGMAMISGGFGIYKVLHCIAVMTALSPRHPQAPRNLGLFLLGLGAGGPLIGMLENIQVTPSIGQRAWRRPSLFVAFAIFILRLSLLI